MLASPQIAAPEAVWQPCCETMCACACVKPWMYERTAPQIDAVNSAAVDAVNAAEVDAVGACACLGGLEPS